MPDPEELNVTPKIDRFIHEPARLAILTVLAACQRADFIFLERATGLTRGNLSVQLTRLEEARFITIEKTIERKRTLTTAALLPRGRQGLDAYWQSMDELRSRAAAGEPAARPEPTRKPKAARPGFNKPAGAPA